MFPKKDHLTLDIFFCSTVKLRNTVQVVSRNLLAMEPFNFNELPEVIRRLFEKVEDIERMVTNLQPNVTDENELLDVKEAAHFLKISVASLYTKVSRKEIPVSKPGKRLYFNRAELREWIDLAKKKTARQITLEAAKRVSPNKMSRFIRD